MIRDLRDGWQACVTAADAPMPSDPAWRDAPGVALPFDARRIADELDGRDVWLRRPLPLDAPFRGRLILPSIGPLAEIFVGGELRASTRSLHRAHAVELDLPAGAHELTIRLPSPARFLEERRPRPRWKTRLVAHQQLRFLRTPLLGRMPGWSPDGAPRGVLAPPRLVASGRVDPASILRRVRVDGDRGRVQITLPGVEARGGELVLGGAIAPLMRGADGLHAELTLPSPPRWWPHTHGEPVRLPATLTVDGVAYPLPAVGFRTVTVADPRRFALRVNDVPVFCRGAVFVPDPRRDDPEADRRALVALRDAGGNMVRIGGTMRYEDARFFEWCDELGLLVWQDLMFANMDYPEDDPAFMAEVDAELDGQLARLAAHPSVAVLCGGSEVAQQAAMVGQPPDRWYGPLFSRTIPERCDSILPGVPYVPGSPSSPLDGDGPDAPPPLPFRPDVGVAHYYGVGAYLRPFEDARRADVAFASECLALSNVPEPAAVDALFGDAPPAVHAPRWKAGVPRDHGAGWDFEDVRDHYHALLFGGGAIADRATDTDGYLERARATSVEVLTRTFAEWRRAGSATQGGLVWFLRDLHPGAGWGLLDVDGGEKAPLLALRRVWSPTALLLTDEGTNGLRLHVVHDGPAERALVVRVTLWRDGEILVAEAARDVIAPPRSARSLDVEGLFGAFRDVGYAYRFGPRAHDALLATLHAGEVLVGEAAHLPRLDASPRDPGLAAEGERVDERVVRVRVRASRLAAFVAVRMPGWRADAGYFHLAPGAERTVTLTARVAPAPPARGAVHALGAAPARVAVA